ncbi:MAG: GIY-YIG nuclease family protein [Pseudomonadales bacterium]
MWTVYIIEASDNSLYTGISTDVERRWQEHMSGKTGAKFFRGRKPRRLVYQQSVGDRSQASQLEAEIKKLSRAKKLELIAANVS